MKSNGKYTIELTKKSDGGGTKQSKIDFLIEQFMLFKGQEEKRWAEQEKRWTNQQQFNAKVADFITNQQKFNEFVLEQFKSHGWVK